MATVPPYSNALSAVLLAMETRIPLLVDFRDPWTRIDVAWVIANPLFRRLSELLKRAVLRVSNRIVMADEARYAREFFAGTDAARQCKLTSILNGYDEEDFASITAFVAPPDKFVVTYVGNFYDAPNFANVRSACELWHALFPSELEQVEFHYAGPSSAFFDEYGFRPRYLRDHGYVSHKTAIALRAQSHVQIFSQPITFKPHVLSGKIYEMMRIAVPILALTSPSGAVARFVSQTGTGVIADNAKPECAAKLLRQFYLAWKHGYLLTARNEDAVAAFSRENQAKQLHSVLEEMIGETALQARLRKSERRPREDTGGALADETKEQSQHTTTGRRL